VTLTGNYTSGYSEVATDAAAPTTACQHQHVTYNSGTAVVCSVHPTFTIDMHTQARSTTTS
jgi:hypothetical protein